MIREYKLFSNTIISFTCLSQTISGLGNPVALHTSFTVDPFRTVMLRPGLSIEITGGTETVRGDKSFEMAYNAIILAMIIFFRQ